MNKFLIIFLILLLNVPLYGQNKRFFYEHTYADDSTTVKSFKKGLMVLDVSRTGSK